ncbi:DUF6344 domain-containing protein [Streptomyces sp. NPDC090022]|uniref:DUF6344 domain-containing protein n=1 Tax=Streptomyces sp. NPDC090022 TaxID=3365920 RepID=UPI0038252EAC
MAAKHSFFSIWTVVIAAVVAFLAGLGIGAKAAAPSAGVAPAAGTATAPASAARPEAVVRARRSWREVMRGGALPPTIAQRIRAEAHGSAPSARRSTTAAATVGERDDVALMA